MPRRIHMQDQVGANKIEEIMRHDYGQCSVEQWALKFAVVGAFLLLGVYW
ncbi:hypothetical protein [Methylobacter sp. YRD-M1]|nr:hypothetical protein [Methylobacter sp. YRD-M1]WAK04624.1 hypothetical protein LZ558_22485 [Methylobacter sp. YRD-M1]